MKIFQRRYYRSMGIGRQKQRSDKPLLAALSLLLRCCIISRQCRFLQEMNRVQIIYLLNFIRPGMFNIIFGTRRGENTKVNPVTNFFMTTHLICHYLILIIVHVTENFIRNIITDIGNCLGQVMRCHELRTLPLRA